MSSGAAPLSVEKLDAQGYTIPTDRPQKSRG